MHANEMRGARSTNHRGGAGVRRGEPGAEDRESRSDVNQSCQPRRRQPLNGGGELRGEPPAPQCTLLARTHTHTHTHMHACTHTHTRTRMHTRTHAHTCVHAHTHTRACMHAHTHTHTHTHRCESNVYISQKVSEYSIHIFDLTLGL